MSKTIIQGKFYRVSYNGEGVYEALRKKVGWDWKTVKQDPDINWLPTPQVEEYKDTYRSFFTTLGYKTFQAKTMKVIDKYLDPEKIKVNEYNDISGIIMYKDQYQVVVDQGDVKTMTIDESVKKVREVGEWLQNQLYPDPKPEQMVNEEVIIDEIGIVHDSKCVYPIEINEEDLKNPDEELLAYRKARRPVLEEMQRKYNISDEEIEEMRMTEEAIHLWVRQSKGYKGYERRR